MPLQKAIQAEYDYYKKVNPFLADLDRRVLHSFEKTFDKEHLENELFPSSLAACGYTICQGIKGIGHGGAFNIAQRLRKYGYIDHIGDWLKT